MNAVIRTEEKAPELPPAVVSRGIQPAQWRTLMNNLFPGAKGESVLMVWDYCVARKLDPMKKPCHIVPMKVGATWRDVVMAGIYEYRTTANRTGEYLGHAKPVYGPDIECMGVTAPEYCEFTVYRWNPKAQQRGEYGVTVYFREAVATKWENDKQVANQRWAKAPRQMLTKCAEAAALREAFPDEFGGEHTFEEMEGQQVIEEARKPLPKANPRGDTSHVDLAEVETHISNITDLISEYGSDEAAIALQLQSYVAKHLQADAEVYTVVGDELAKRGIISKAAWKKYV